MTTFEISRQSCNIIFSVYLFCVYFILINTLSVIQNAEMREGNTTLLVIKSVTF